ncbi:MAG: hypothetical protein Ct9H300mP21_07870 [Pseudomonadota bacterium]|nr:MAG: hypothetical protein Ct9H300mP21_07870 [Pseudomonadota bacterium]
MFGLGCFGRYCRVARLRLFERTPGRKRYLLLLTLFINFTGEDFRLQNLFPGALFWDGAAAVLLVGDQHPLGKVMKKEIAKLMSFMVPKFPKRV